MMAVEGRPASAGPDTRRSPVTDRRAMSADTEPRTLAARKAYPEPSPEDDADAPLDLTVHTRKEITVREFARHPFADPADYVRAQTILRQSRDYLAAGRDSGTESDDSAGRLSPGEDPTSGKAYKKSLMKRYSKFTIFHEPARPSPPCLSTAASAGVCNYSTVGLFTTEEGVTGATCALYGLTDP